VNGRHSLVVDDQPDVANAIAALLGSLGFDSSVITDPYVAMDTVESVKPEVVFLDLNMPGLTGLDLARMLRKKYGWQKLKIVAVTALTSEEHRTATRDAGFDAHIAKPVELALLESVLHRLFPESRWTTKPLS
jgi:two-component system OmpR family response regulator